MKADEPILDVLWRMCWNRDHLLREIVEAVRSGAAADGELARLRTIDLQITDALRALEAIERVSVRAPTANPGVGR